MNNNTYRAVIHDLIDKINNTKYLKRLCQLTTYLYTNDESTSQKEEPPVQTAEHKRMMGKIQKVRNMDIYKYTLYTDDMNIIKDLAAGDSFTVIGYSFDYGFYQGMQYMKDKQRKKAKKNIRQGSRADKLQQLMKLAERIPDKRLDALLCWANQYQQGEGEPVQQKGKYSMVEECTQN